MFIISNLKIVLSRFSTLGITDAKTITVKIGPWKSENRMKMKLAAIAVAATIAVTSVQAIPITGTISMGGQAILNSTDLSSATAVESWQSPYVVAGTGSFGSIPTFTANILSIQSPWTFQPGGAVSGLWTVDGFTFNLEGDTVSQSSTFLDITGYGTISASGYDTTDFIWNLAAEAPATGGPMEFTFSAAAGASTGGGSSVPDGGFTVAFLGLALASVEGLRRKLCKA
jgi:hypothetical protein